MDAQVLPPASYGLLAHRPAALPSRDAGLDCVTEALSSGEQRTLASLDR
jgi:hypothetical protein